MHLIFCLLPMPIFEGSNKIGSVRPSVQAFSQNSIISFFHKSDMVLESHMKLFMAAGFSGKNFFCLQNWENGPKTGFFQYIGKFCDLFWLHLFYNENWYYLLCSCTNPIFKKIFIPEIWAKCSQPIRLQDFLINHRSRTSQWNSLIFCMLIQIHIN